MKNKELVIKIIGQPGVVVFASDSPIGQYLLRYDPEAYEGLGSVDGTLDKSKALKFTSVGQALAFIRQQPRARPFREDGRPNRPITVFNLSFESL